MFQNDCARFNLHPHCVEEIFVRELAAKSAETICQLTRQSVNSLGDRAQSFGSVINRIHRGNDREKNLSCADIARRFVATDVLLPRLQRQSIRGAAFSVM